MTNSLLLARRNLMLYYRDKTNVFLSFLGAIILFALYVLFLHALNFDGIVDKLDDRGIEYDAEDVSYFVSVWVYAGIVMVTSVTTGLGALVGYVDDRTSQRFSEFVVMPIKRWQIVAGYYISSFTAAATMSTAILGLGWGVIWLLHQQAPGPLRILQAWGFVLFGAAAFSAFNIFLISLVNTVSAFVTESTIMGGMIGFAAAAYIPENMMPDRVRDIVNLLPFAQAAALIRRPMSGDAADVVARGSPTFRATLRQNYGLDLPLGPVFDLDPILLPWWLPIVELTAMTVICGAIAIWKLNRRIR
ncbi:MAG: ABC transporter permease [Propionibacteriaceae bacterium]|jgi:multidrug/hemolysin transport system permease protein|nr:ABC transporter permease [Propionibacteriaceae bacterium]